MLCYLQPIKAMKPSPHSIKPSQIIPLFSLFFPKKIRFLSHQSRTFASKSLHYRAGSGSGSGPQLRAAKSLIDDEADLSDMVSSFNSRDFLKTRVYSDSDNDTDNGKGRASSRVMEGRGRGRGRSSRGGGRNDNMRSREDGRESNEGFSRGGSRRGGRFGGQGEGLRGSSIRDRDSMTESRRGGERSDMGREMRGGRSNMGRGGIRTGERVSIRRRDFAFSDGEADKDGIRRGEGGSRGRGGIRSGERGNRGRGGIRSGEKDNTRRRGFALSDEDETEEDKGFKSFKGLIGSEEDENDETDEEGEDVDLVNNERVTSPPSSSSSGDSYLTETRFDQCSVSPLSMKALKDAGYEKMTVVQEATLPVILKGKDVMAKARTGTGKTVAFLLPSIDVVEKTPAASRDQQRPPVLVLIICPTRELACQAAAEANKLLKYHPSLGVQVVIGGTRLSMEQKRMQANPCQIIVATPGRLKDHIENTAGFATRLTGIKVLVLDEADHLLDMGFRKDIERIITAVPKQRQTLLFSATIPPEVKQICHIALKRDYEYINTVQEGSEETHTQVRQTHLVASLDNHFPLLYTLLKDHIADNVDYKVLVFCTTAMVTRLIAELLGELNLNVREIHSRKSQSYRTKVSDEFRKSKSLILVTSDVSARGVDYPDVTLVVQLGLPADKQQYIHRLGRTGRRGKEGEGVLLLAPWEEFFLSAIKDIPITKAPIPLVDPESKKKVEISMSRVGMKEKESAYQAWLGYYNSNKNVGKDKSRLVELANEFSRTMGLDSPPAIPKMILGKMGLKNVPGLRSK